MDAILWHAEIIDFALWGGSDAVVVSLVVLVADTARDE